MASAQEVPGRVDEYGRFASAEPFRALKADSILANPPFTMSDWGGERLREDKRGKLGLTLVGTGNYTAATSA